MDFHKIYKLKLQIASFFSSSKSSILVEKIIERNVKKYGSAYSKSEDKAANAWISLAF